MHAARAMHPGAWMDPSIFLLQFGSPLLPPAIREYEAGAMIPDAQANSRVPFQIATSVRHSLLDHAHPESRWHRIWQIHLASEALTSAHPAPSPIHRFESCRSDSVPSPAPAVDRSSRPRVVALCPEFFFNDLSGGIPQLLTVIAGLQDLLADHPIQRPSKGVTMARMAAK